MPPENAGSSTPAFAVLTDQRPPLLVRLRQKVLGAQELWITFAVLVIGLGVTQISPHFGTLSNLGNVLQNLCFIGILALGMTPVIISGGIDISIGSVMGWPAWSMASCCRPTGHLSRRPLPRWPRASPAAASTAS